MVAASTVEATTDAVGIMAGPGTAIGQATVAGPDTAIAQAGLIGAVPPAGMPEAASAVTVRAHSTAVVAPMATAEAGSTAVAASTAIVQADSMGAEAPTAVAATEAGTANSVRPFSSENMNGWRRMLPAVLLLADGY